MDGGVETPDGPAPLYECGICRMWFIIRADGSTAEVVFEE
jgi:hypothetical protein